MPALSDDWQMLPQRFTFIFEPSPDKPPTLILSLPPRLLFFITRLAHAMLFGNLRQTVGLG